MILLLIFMALLVLALFYPKSRILTMVISLFLLFVYAFTWHAGDLEVYEWVYHDFTTGRFFTAYEPAFVFLMWLCRNIGLSFTAFRFILGSLIITGVYGFIKRQTDYTSLAMALYGLFPFFMFASILRSGIACVFILRAIEFLIDEKRDKTRFVIFVLIGTLFHYSCVLILPFLFFCNGTQKKKLAWVFAGVCGLTALISFTNVVYMVVSKFTNRQKILTWFAKGDATANIKGIIGIAVLLASLYFLNKYTLIMDESIDGERQINSLRTNQVMVSYQMAVYMVFLSPLMVLASPFMRIPYMVFLLFIVSSVNANQIKDEDFLNRKPSTLILAFSWIALIATIIIWKFYADLPYLKSGAHIFSEYIDASFEWVRFKKY